MDQHRGDVTLGRCGNNHVHLCVVSKDGGRDELGRGEVEGLTVSGKESTRGRGCGGRAHTGSVHSGAGATPGQQPVTWSLGWRVPACVGERRG